MFTIVLNSKFVLMCCERTMKLNPIHLCDIVCLQKKKDVGYSNFIYSFPFLQQPSLFLCQF